MYNGILNIYKEKGFTSHDVVAKLRGITHQKKIGHTGTLDPDAEGVLPVCLGSATKLCELLTDKDKTYEAVLLLGITTDTQDVSGTVLERKEVNVSEKQVREVIGGFVGIYGQIPPMYSAVRKNGKKLYELARAGVTVEREARMVTIHQIRILDMHLPRVTMEVECARGTYIRTLCEDIGVKLGCGGCMESLLRTKSGSFLLEDSLKLEEAGRLQEEGNLQSVVMPTDCFFSELPAVHMKPEGDKPVHNGNPFAAGLTADSASGAGDRADGVYISGMHRGEVRVYDSEKCFIGVYRYDGKKHQYFPVKMFPTL